MDSGRIVFGAILIIVGVLLLGIAKSIPTYDNIVSMALYALSVILMGFGVIQFIP